MKAARWVWLVAMLAFLVGVSASAQVQHFYRVNSGTTTVLTDISPDGWLTWNNATVGGTCTIEHASSLLGSNVWHYLLQRSVTASVMRVNLFAPPGDMVPIPGGTNSGTDPEFGEYSLTNDAALYMDKYEVTNDKMVEVLNWAYGQGKLDMTNPNSVSNAQGNSQELLILTNAGCRITWNGSSFGMKAAKGSGYPCVLVTWYGAVAFCNYRSESEGRTPCYDLSDWSCNLSANGYRLPTDEEWHYAGRGGVSSKRFPWGGDTIQHSRANYNSTSTYHYDTSPTRGYHPDYDDGGFPYTSPVGSFESGKNGYGLYDMAGNVFEWCYDWRPGYEGSLRVIRGGYWGPVVFFCRVAAPYGYNPGGSDFSIGFRAVLAPGQ